MSNHRWEMSTVDEMRLAARSSFMETGSSDVSVCSCLSPLSEQVDLAGKVDDVDRCHVKPTVRRDIMVL